MRRYALTVITVYACLGAMAPSAIAARPPCKPRGATTLGESTKVVVVKLTNGRTQVCDRISRRTRRLDTSEDSAAYVLAVVDRFVAFQLYVTERTGGRVTVRLMDGVRRNLISVHEASTGSDQPHITPDRGVRELELEKNGSMAWISEPSDAPNVFEVWYARRGQRANRLDRSGGVVLGSLASSGPWVYWMSGSTAQSARVG